MARRSIGICLTVVFVAVFTFCVSRALPSDAARTLAGERASQETVVRVRHQLGLDRPVGTQFIEYMGDLARGDLGYSYVQESPVRKIVGERLPWTIALALAALFVQLVIGIPLGLALATDRRGIGRVFEKLALGGSLVVIALPAFWLGLMMLYLFAFRLSWVPLRGSDSPSGVILPALALGLPGAAWYSRIVRETARDILGAEFVIALRAKGTRERVILYKHVLRATLSPVMTMMAMDFGYLLGGAVIIESVFAWPGMGYTTYQSMLTGDVPVLMAAVLLGSIFVLVMNLLADIGRRFVDPRIRQT